MGHLASDHRLQDSKESNACKYSALRFSELPVLGTVYNQTWLFKDVFFWSSINPTFRSHSSLHDLCAYDCPAVSGSNLLTYQGFQVWPGNTLLSPHCAVLFLYWLCHYAWVNLSHHHQAGDSPGRTSLLTSVLPVPNPVLFLQTCSFLCSIFLLEEITVKTYKCNSTSGKVLFLKGL